MKITANTASAASEFVGGEQTMSASGPAIPVSSTRYSLGEDPLILGIDSSREQLKPEYLI